MIAIASTYTYKRNRNHEYFEHNYVLVELVRREGILYWVPLESELARQFSIDCNLQSLERIQSKYQYKYVGQLKHGEKPYEDKDFAEDTNL